MGSMYALTYLRKEKSHENNRQIIELNGPWPAPLPTDQSCWLEGYHWIYHGNGKSPICYIGIYWMIFPLKPPSLADFRMVKHGKTIETGCSQRVPGCPKIRYGEFSFPPIRSWHFLLAVYNMFQPIFRHIHIL